MTGRVYVICGDGEDRPVKIGFSKKPARRAAGLSTGSGKRFYVVFSKETEHSRLVEKEAHSTLKAYRTIGEWFDTDCETAIAAVTNAIAKFEDYKPPVRRWHSDRSDADKIKLSRKMSRHYRAFPYPHFRFSLPVSWPGQVILTETHLVPTSHWQVTP